MPEELPSSPDELNGLNGLSEKIDLRVGTAERSRWYEYANAQGMSAAELIRSAVNARVG